jgi:hypothetical protein
MIDPTGDFYHFKYISSILSCLIFGIYFFVNKRYFNINYVQSLILIIFCVLMPLYGLLVTFLNTEIGKINDTSYLGFSVLLLLLLPVVFIKRKIFLNTLILALRSLSLLIVIILFSFILDTDSNGLAQFFIERGSMLVGFREYAGIQTYYLYFTASPLLIILVAYDSYCLTKEVTVFNIFLFTLSTISIFLSGTRFNMLVAIIILPITLLIYKFSLKNSIYYLVMISFFFILLFQNSFISSFFNSNEGSNSVKVGYIDTYLSIFKQPEVLILGQGFNASNSSILFKNMLINFGNEGTKTELTFVELFRVFGLFFGFFFNIAILSLPFLLYRKIREINFIIIGITFYLLSSFLNPYIFSTNGVVIFLLILVVLQNDNTNNNYNFLT